MSKETFAFPSQPRRDFSEWSFAWLGVVERGRQQLHTWQSWLEGRRVVTSAHQNWDNTHYCRSLSQDAPVPYSYQQLLALFPANFRTFTDEYCLGTVVQEYPLAVTSNGTTGIDDSYQEPLTDQAKRFQEKVATQGKHQQRSTVESWNSQRLEHWLQQVCTDDRYPPGSKLVWCSPPGFVVEGYHGTSPRHHSFIWVYQKQLTPAGQPEVTMTQFRCWPNLRQLEQIQTQLRDQQTVGSLPDSTTPDAFAPNSSPRPQLTRRNQVIAELIELPPTVSMEEIEAVIYQTEDQWQVQTTDMPQLDQLQRDQFAHYRELLLHQFLLPMYQNVLAPAAELTLPYDAPFWRSREYRQIIAQLDLIFALAWQHLLKFVEQPPLTTDLQQQHTQLQQLRELYQLKLKAEDGAATKTDRQRFNQIAPQLLSIGSTALSVGQCGVGTLIPVQLFRGLDGLNGLSHFNSLSQLSPLEVLKLSAAEKLALKTEVLGQYQPFTVVGRFGQRRRFWVPREYYQDYLKGSQQLSSGEFVGPCQISLTDGSDSLVLTDDKFQQLLAATRLSPLDQLAQLNAEERTQLAQTSSATERAQIQQQFQRRRALLKERVSITELVNDDLFYPTFTRV